jgi:hypothetical protein
METQFSEDFRKKFLIIFTSELIKNYSRKEITKLESIVGEKRKGEKIPVQIPRQQIAPQQIIFRKETPVFNLAKKEIPKKIEFIPGGTRQIAPLTRKRVQQVKPILIIPEPALPKHLEYLKPLSSSPSEKVEIDLGKLNPLLKDSAVKIIEGSPDERVKVMGTMGTRVTDIFLSKEEVEEVINKFSEVSKIPTIEGVYRVVVGNLILSAIISDVVNPRFVIKKIPSQPLQNKNPNQQIILRK